MLIKNKKENSSTYAYKILAKTNNILKKIIVSKQAGKQIYYMVGQHRNPLFNSVEIETTSICNRKCEYCPNFSIKRPQGFMKEELFNKIIDELSAINYSGRFSPHFYGEPLLDKRIVEFVKYAREKLPNAFIKFFTNGDLLTYERFVQLTDAGVNVFRIAQHDKKPAETLEQTLRQIDSKTKKERIELVKYYKNDDLLMNRGGLVEVEHDVKMKYCSYISGVTIDFEGNMLLCCQDYLSKYTFGNLKKEQIIDVWNKKNYKKIRDQVGSGIWSVEICKTCNDLIQNDHKKQ